MKHSLRKFTRLVEALETLPSIGHKSATRLAYHMIMRDNFSALKISLAIEEAIGSLKKCLLCGGMSEDEICSICCDERRDSTKLCIVDDAKDIITIEENALFDGRYFVLDTLENIDISHLQSVASSGVKEIIFALTPSIASDALILYIEDKLADLKLEFTKIAQGVPTGVSLENIDVLSLTRALEDRVKV